VLEGLKEKKLNVREANPEKVRASKRRDRWGGAVCM